MLTLAKLLFSQMQKEIYNMGTAYELSLLLL